jgi:hypothetical protein
MVECVSSSRSRSSSSDCCVGVICRSSVSMLLMMCVASVCSVFSASCLGSSLSAWFVLCMWLWSMREGSIRLSRCEVRCVCSVFAASSRARAVCLLLVLEEEEE